MHGVWSSPFTGLDWLVASAEPIRRIEAGCKAAAKAREPPITRSLGEVVLDRIEMNLIHVRGVVAIVPDRVLPVTALPNTALALAEPDTRYRFGIGQ